MKFASNAHCVFRILCLQTRVRKFLEAKALKRWAQKKLNAEREIARARLLEEAAQTAINQEAGAILES